MIRVFATAQGLVLERQGQWRRAGAISGIDALFTAEDPAGLITTQFAHGASCAPPDADALLAPIGTQEVWAAGVTYLRSKDARIQESREAGGGSFYDRVYHADRPELFFKATPHRVARPGGAVRIRSDSMWNVPEPELTLAIDATGRIFGYTIGNDMSSRDIEGENPLYLPQAKTWAGCAALGPCLVVDRALPAADTVIAMQIRRAGTTVFSGETQVGRIRRPLPSLAAFLYRDNAFPHGAYLMTGTGIVPPDSFTLARGDEIRITIGPVGTLSNIVA